MNSAKYLQLIVMVMGLGIVVFTMRQFSNPANAPTFFSLLGIAGPQPSVDASSSSTNVVPQVVLTRLNWCDTRVRELERPGVFRLYQSEAKWFFEAGSKVHEVDFVAVEKWFARHCNLHVEILPQTGSVSASQPLLVVHFIKGPNSVFSMSPAGIYSWKGQSFKSPELESAQAYLMQLPTPTVPGQTPRESPGDT